MFNMENKLGVDILVREENMDGKTVFIVNNEDTGIADFGDSLEEAIENFKKALELFLDTYPEKREIFIKKESKTPLMVSRIFL